MYVRFPAVKLQQYLPFTVLKRKTPIEHVVIDRVATVLTVYGIETSCYNKTKYHKSHKLQQYLPFTVLKQLIMMWLLPYQFWLQQYLPFTVLKRHRQGARSRSRKRLLQQYLPFTVLKLIKLIGATKDSNRLLQQYLPFTVLKPGLIRSMKSYFFMLQQYLPFTVLKLTTVGIWVFNKVFIELQQYLPFTVLKHLY